MGCSSGLDAWHTNMDGYETCNDNNCAYGWIRCQYSDRCNGHYYWYTEVVPGDGYCSRALSDIVSDNVVANVRITGKPNHELLSPAGRTIAVGPALMAGSCGSYLSDDQLRQWGQAQNIENLCRSHFCSSNLDAWHTNMDGYETCNDNNCAYGWIRCQYSDRCNGHYYWYTEVVPGDGFCQHNSQAKFLS